MWRKPELAVSFFFFLFFWFIDSVHSKDGTAFCAGGGFSWLIGSHRSPEPPNGNQNWHLKMLCFPGTRFSKVPKSCFKFAVFTFNIKVSIILKMIQWKYQLTRQNWPVCELGTLPLFNKFWFQNLASDKKRYQAHRETGSRVDSDKL